MTMILIVDDDQDFATAAALALSKKGHTVSIESSVDDGLASMLRQRPDLLILDVMFSEDVSAGFGLARAMRHYHESLKDVPVLLVTAVNAKFPLGFSSRDIDEQWLPVADILEKPLDLEHLVKQVAALLENRATELDKEGDLDSGRAR